MERKHRHTNQSMYEGNPITLRRKILKKTLLSGPKRFVVIASSFGLLTFTRKQRFAFSALGSLTNDIQLCRHQAGKGLDANFFHYIVFNYPASRH